MSRADLCHAGSRSHSETGVPHAHTDDAIKLAVDAGGYERPAVLLEVEAAKELLGGCRTDDVARRAPLAKYADALDKKRAL